MFDGGKRPFNRQFGCPVSLVGRERRTYYPEARVRIPHGAPHLAGSGSLLEQRAGPKANIEDRALNDDRQLSI